MIIKRMMAMVIAMSLVICVNCNTANVYALGSEGLEDSNENFTDNIEDCEYIEQKVEDELKEDTGLLIPEIEEELNKQGVFDDEIEQYAEEYASEYVNELNKSEPEDIKVQAQYYEIYDTEELEGVSVKEEELVPASAEDVNEYLAEEYYDENLDDKDSDNSSIVEWVLEKIGIKSVNVHAETQSKGGQNDKNNKTMLKKTIICTRAKSKDRKGKKYLYVHAIFKWDKMPKYRDLDTLSIKWNNAVYYDYEYEKNTSVSHFWTKHQYDYRTDVTNGKVRNVSTKGYSVNMKENANYHILKNNQYYLDDNGIRCAVKLHEDTEKGLTEIPYTRAKEYSCEGVGIILYLTKKPKDDIVIFYPYYKHLRTKLNWVSVAVELADDGKFTVIYNLVKDRYYEVENSFVGVNGSFRFEF